MGGFNTHDTINEAISGRAYLASLMKFNTGWSFDLLYGLINHV